MRQFKGKIRKNLTKFFGTLHFIMNQFEGDEQGNPAPPSDNFTFHYESIRRSGNSDGNTYGWYLYISL